MNRALPFNAQELLYHQVRMSFAGHDVKPFPKELRRFPIRYSQDLQAFQLSTFPEKCVPRVPPGGFVCEASAQISCDRHGEKASELLRQGGG